MASTSASAARILCKGCSAGEIWAHSVARTIPLLTHGILSGAAHPPQCACLGPLAPLPAVQ